VEPALRFPRSRRDGPMMVAEVVEERGAARSGLRFRVRGDVRLRAVRCTRGRGGEEKAGNNDEGEILHGLSGAIEDERRAYLRDSAPNVTRPACSCGEEHLV